MINFIMTEYNNGMVINTSHEYLTNDLHKCIKLFKNCDMTFTYKNSHRITTTFVFNSNNLIQDKTYISKYIVENNLTSIYNNNNSHIIHNNNTIIYSNKEVYMITNKYYVLIGKFYFSTVSNQYSISNTHHLESYYKALYRSRTLYITPGFEKVSKESKLINLTLIHNVAFYEYAHKNKIYYIIINCGTDRHSSLIYDFIPLNLTFRFYNNEKTYDQDIINDYVYPEINEYCKDKLLSLETTFSLDLNDSNNTVEFYGDYLTKDNINYLSQVMQNDESFKVKYYEHESPIKKEELDLLKEYKELNNKRLERHLKEQRRDYE